MTGDFEQWLRRPAPILWTRIVPTPWTPAHIDAAMTGVVPFVSISAEEFRRQYSRVAPVAHCTCGDPDCCAVDP
jgi:hypothetical protein